MVSILTMLFRKMMKSKWLVLSLITGMTIATALLSSIPTYTDGILQRMLLKDLQNYQEENRTYPGGMHITLGHTAYTQKAKTKVFNRIDSFLDTIPGIMPLPLIEKVKLITADTFKWERPEKDNGKSKKSTFFNLSAYSGLENHIKIIDGRMPGLQKTNGIYEGIVTEEALEKLELVVGKELTVTDIINDKSEPFKLKIAGVFQPKSSNDVFWYNHPSRHSKDIFINYDLMNNDFVQQNRISSGRLEWYFCYDYNAIKLQNVSSVLAAEEKIKEKLKSINAQGVDLKFHAKTIIESFFDKRQQILTVMFSINVPILVMLGFFILMVSLLKIEREKTEISVLASRGANRIQVLVSYIAEGCILAAAAMVSGPFFGLFMSKLLGASNGFLEFVNRTALDVTLQKPAILYALWGVLFSVLMLAVPAYINSGISVVRLKQSLARAEKKPFWQKTFLDVILLFISCYGIYVFNRRQRDLLATGLTAKALEIDPLLFVVPALFMIAAGLIFLRIFPLLVGFLFRLGRHFWPPSIYAVLIQAGRSTGQYNFIMLFMIFTLALGLFSANAARTLNLNSEEKIKYSMGADIVIQPVWNVYGQDSGMGGFPGMVQEKKPSFGPKQYIEPDFDQFSKLKGVEIATKVYSTDKCSVSSGDSTNRVHLMAIDTEEFGRISWFREDLLPHHWYEYLNILAQEPASALVSKSLANAANLEPGDMINLTWGESGSAPFIVFGIIDYWPAWNPNPRVIESTENGKKKYVTEAEPMLVVANLQYIQDNMSLEPYDIWIKLKPGAETADLYSDIGKRRLEVKKLVNMKEELIKLKNDPFQLGINGALTLGFIICVIVCLIGFIIYWSLSIRARELQFGIYRAMGIHMRELIGMLAYEQVLISGTSVLAGVLVGKLTSRLFIPFFQLSYSSYEQVPPFRIVFYLSDHLKLYILTGGMLVTGLAILGLLVSRIRMAQALKLGEE